WEKKEEKKKLKLYYNHLSSCSNRVQIALNLKGLECEYQFVNLSEGEQLSPEFKKLNPIGYVPVLVDGDTIISDSLAIITYLDDTYPQHPLLPRDIDKRAINIQAANIVATSIQPFQNLAIAKYTGDNVNREVKVIWAKYHIKKGFVALEKLLHDHAGKYATGDEVCLADLFLAPQVNAAIKRFNVDMMQYPLLSRLKEAYEKHPAFKDALPDIPLQS
ncbi:glutathione S-transferase zeta class-like, partial [Diospyros lotus]|uniref:glutathione S-transferase zeta class-like n=1 Tax=Diospyros lotus TaxID=55363 RepID=UPI00224EE672